MEKVLVDKSELFCMSKYFGVIHIDIMVIKHVIKIIFENDVAKLLRNSVSLAYS